MAEQIPYWGNYNNDYLALFPYYAKKGLILAMPLDLFCKIDTKEWLNSSVVLFRRGTNIFRMFVLHGDPEVACFSSDGMTLAVATKKHIHIIDLAD
jgi:hypothetical protein